MFHNLIASSTGGETILKWIDFAALCIEVLAVIIIVVAIIYAMTHYLVQSVLHPEIEDRYLRLKFRLGRALLLGLEILVAADIVRTRPWRLPLRALPFWAYWC